MGDYRLPWTKRHLQPSLAVLLTTSVLGKQQDFKILPFNLNRGDAECEAVRRLLDQLSAQATAEDLVVLGKVTSLVYQRAAKFVAVGIAAIVREVIIILCHIMVILHNHT